MKRPRGRSGDLESQPKRAWDDEGVRCEFQRAVCGVDCWSSPWQFRLPLAGPNCDSESWHPDFESAEAEARQLGRPMLVHFHAKWCGPCQEMEHTVLRDPVLLKQLRTGFVAVKVDSDERPDLRKRFQVERLPTDIFLDPRGYVLKRTSGIHDRDSYLGMVASVDASLRGPARRGSFHRQGPCCPNCRESTSRPCRWGLRLRRSHPIRSDPGRSRARKLSRCRWRRQSEASPPGTPVHARTGGAG